MKRFIVFAIKVIVAHVITYFIIGAISYPLLTKQFYVGPDPIFSTFMRTQANPTLWQHVMIWFIPGQVLRGFLIALVLYPFFDTLKYWGYWKRFLSISSLYIVLGFWAAAVAAPGTIDGTIYMRPEISQYAHLMVQPEILIQGLSSGLLIAWLMVPRRKGVGKTIG